MATCEQRLRVVLLGLTALTTSRQRCQPLAKRCTCSGGCGQACTTATHD